MKGQPYQLEVKISEFESDWNEDAFSRARKLLPEKDDPQFVEALAEFIRVDMEFRFEAGNPCVANDYLTEYPVLKEIADTKSLLVFEEFRLRNIFGDYIAAEVIASHYDVSIASWPNVDFNNGASSLGRSLHANQFKFDRKQLPKIGEVFKNFRIIGKLGEGAFGTVMLAQQKDMAGRLTVLKFVPPFSDEHSFLARLQHSNIVPVYSVHTSEHFIAICMPFMGVATLGDLNGNSGNSTTSVSRVSMESRALIETTNRLKEKTIERTISDQQDLELFQRRNRLELSCKSNKQITEFRRFAAETVLAIAEGLSYAHEHGIIHGDLKPANILINDDGSPVLLDFHLASSKSEGIGSHVGGTLAYMAPEHFDALESNKQVDARTDVFSVGIILHELVIGRLPFADDLTKNSLNELKENRQKLPRFSNEEQHQLGNDLVEIVKKCIAPDPDNRYQNGTELAEDLRAHLGNQKLIHAKDSNLANRFRKWSRRNPRLASASSISGIAAVLILGLIVAFFVVNARLAKARALSDSQEIITEFQRIRQPLATYTYFDRDHFDDAIVNASQTLARFDWETVEQFGASDRVQNLSDERRRIEQTAAGELHFWIAVANQRIALELGTHVEDRAKLLAQAELHNDLAYKFAPSKCLKLMNDKIEFFKANPNGSYQIGEIPKVTSKLDRTIAAFMLRLDELRSRPLWQESLEQDPTDSLDWLCLGQNYYRLNEFKNAKACFTVCIGLEPKNIYPRIQRAMAVIEDGTDLEIAKEDLLFAYEQLPNDFVVIQNLALVYGKLRDFNSAKTYYDKAIELGTSNTRVWYLRSRVNRILGNREQADRDFQKFLGLEPTLGDSISWRVRGTQKIKTDPNAALNDLQQSLAINKNDVVTLNNIAHIYSEKLGDLNNAIEAMNRVVEISPKSAKYLATRGVLLARLGNRNLAIADAKKCLKMDQSADTFYRLAGIFAQTSKVNESDRKQAFKFLKLAISKDSELVIKMISSDPDVEPLKGLTEMNEIDTTLEKLRKYNGK